MSNLSKKFLMEAFEAYVNEGDVAKATRLFQHHWNLKAKECYSLCEAEDETFDVDTPDNFADEVAADVDSENDDKKQQLLIAVDELEDEFQGEESDEVAERFNELRNAIDESAMLDADDEPTTEDIAVIIEDLKADFEANGGISEKAQELFDEISASSQDADVADEEEAPAEVDVDVEEPAETDVEECSKVTEADEEPKSLDVDVDFEKPTDEAETSDETPVEDEEPKGEDESDDLDIIYDAKEQAQELLAKLDELEANEKAEEGEDEEAPATVEEGFEKAKLPRNKLTSEEEGVKTQSMKFGKASSVSLNNKMNVAKTNSAGESADKKVKVEQAPQGNGVKSWTKVAKPENKAKDAKSVLGN